MRKRTIGFCHAMRFILPLDRRPLPAKSVEQFACESLSHITSTTGAGCRQNPTHCQRTAPYRINFHWHLIGRAADALRLDFDGGRSIVERRLQDFSGIALGTIFDHRQRPVHHAAGDAFLAAAHHTIDEHGDQDVVITRIWNDRAVYRTISSRHNDYPLLLLALGRSSTGFWLLCAVLAAALFTTLDAISVQRATHDVIADTRQVLDTHTANQHNAVFLQAMTLYRNVHRFFNYSRQAYTS